MKIKHSIYSMFTIAVTVLPLSLFALLTWYQQSLAALPVLDRPRVSFTLQDQQGQRVTQSALNNRVAVVNFFFTHCPVVCPRMTAQLRHVAQHFKGNDDVVLLSLSVDPERDSVAVLAQYAQRFAVDQEQWHLLTGDKREIYRLARNSFHIEASEGDGGPQDFIHSDRLVLLDRSGAIRGYYEGTNPASTKKLIRDIERLDTKTNIHL